MRRMRHRCDRLQRVAYFVIAVPDRVNSGGRFQTMLVDAPGQFGGDEGKRQSERHLDGQAVGGSIELEKQQSLHGFPHPKTGKDDTHADERKGKPIERSKFH